MGGKGENKIEIERNVWARQKARPYPIGILDLVAEKLDFIGTIVRQREEQLTSKVALATDLDVDFVGSNKFMAEEAFRRFAREIKSLGGGCTSCEETWFVGTTRYQSVKAYVVLGEIDEKTGSIKKFFTYQAAYKRARVVRREARETEERQFPKKDSTPNKKPSPSGRQIKIRKKTEEVLFLVTTIEKPRLVKNK